MSDVSEDPVLVRYEGPIAIITLNLPKRMNAFGLAMRQQLYARLLEVSENDACRAIVLTGAGGNFCSGGDISEMRQRQVLEARMRMDLSTRIFKLLVTGPKPLLAAVEGNVAGAGVSLVAAADYAIAASDARFLVAFMKVGLLPDVGGLWSIPRRVGHRKAMEMAMLAEPFTAQQALDMQLLNRVCEPGRALACALEVAERLVRNPPIAMALLRAALNSAADSVDQAMVSEVNFQSVLQHTEDFGEAATAFMEKRKPVFKGR